MQIKNKVNTQRIPEKNLAKQWISTVSPVIAGVIFVPYIFIFLGRLYSNDFSNFSIQNYINLGLLQGVLVLAILLISAWVFIQNISKQIQRLSELLEFQVNHPQGNSLICDDWITIEKRSDPVGRIAKAMKRLLILKMDHNVLENNLYQDQFSANDNKSFERNSNRLWFSIHEKQVDSGYIS
jgi:hypothetical protein